MLTGHHNSKVTFRFKSAMTLSLIIMSSYRAEHSPNWILLTNFNEDQSYSPTIDQENCVYATIDFPSETNVHIYEYSLEQDTTSYPEKFSIPALDNKTTEEEKRRILNSLPQPTVTVRLESTTPFLGDWVADGVSTDLNIPSVVVKTRAGSARVRRL